MTRTVLPEGTVAPPGWVLATDRLPTSEDADRYGNVLVLCSDYPDHYAVWSIAYLSSLWPYGPVVAMWMSLKGIDPRPFYRPLGSPGT